MRRPSFLAVTSLLLLSHSTAFAQESAPSTAEPTPSTAETATSATPGIVVILASLAAGAALTGYGLTFDCADLDHACHRRAAAPIWGGVGVAAVGSLVGLRLIQTSTTRSVAMISVHGTF